MKSNKNIGSWIIRSLKIVEEFMKEESSVSLVGKGSVVDTTKI